jgi:hypothetical protein
MQSELQLITLSSDRQGLNSIQRWAAAMDEHRAPGEAMQGPGMPWGLSNLLNQERVTGNVKDMSEELEGIAQERGRRIKFPSVYRLLSEPSETGNWLWS